MIELVTMSAMVSRQAGEQDISDLRSAALSICDSRRCYNTSFALSQAQNKHSDRLAGFTYGLLVCIRRKACHWDIDFTDSGETLETNTGLCTENTSIVHSS